MKSIIIAALLSGPGAGVVILILARLIPNDMLEALFYKIGKSFSAKGRGKFGKGFYEPIENFIENSITIICKGFLAGLSADDSNDNGTKKEGEK